jgi:2-polyprenyl-6-methoxyphenol hydroxylase-like FAD-dependent oxidoreductase
VGELILPADAPGVIGARIVSKPAMLEMLVGEAARYPNFRFERGATVREVIDGPDGRVAGVTADAIHGRLEVHADFVIGCDGRSSVLRKRAALQEHRYPQAFDVVWAKLPMPPFMAASRGGRLYVGHGHFAHPIRGIKPLADAALKEVVRVG